MAYIFECDVCNTRQEFQSYDMTDFTRNCAECGQDGCTICISDESMCDNCSEKALDNPPEGA